MTTLIKFTTAGAFAALLSATPAFADFHIEWDHDADGALSMEEFREGFVARVSLTEWDLDVDGRLSEDEFGGAIYSRYDVDATDAIEEAERTRLDGDFIGEGVWSTAAVPDGEVAEELDVASLEPWDVDGDGVILRNEFLDGFRDWGTFGEFDVDVDGALTGGELADGVFARYDDDLDGLIEEPELTDIGVDLGDGGFWDV